VAALVDSWVLLIEILRWTQGQQRGISLPVGEVDPAGRLRKAVYVDGEKSENRRGSRQRRWALVQS
jgi:hypothetical protein